MAISSNIYLPSKEPVAACSDPALEPELVSTAGVFDMLVEFCPKSGCGIGMFGS